MYRLLLFVLIFFSISARAQQGLHVGADAGLNFYPLINVKANLPQASYGPYKASFTGGPWLMYNFRSGIGIKAALYYIPESEQEILTGSFRGQNYKQHNYAAMKMVPLLVRYSFGKRLRGYIDAGAVLNFMDLRWKYSYTTDSTPVQTNTGIEHKRFGVSCAGLGGSYTFNSHINVYLEARYYYGIFINDFSNNAVSLVLGLGYKISN